MSEKSRQTAEAIPVIINILPSKRFIYGLLDPGYIPGPKAIKV
jgi:hypothetical protein